MSVIKNPKKGAICSALTKENYSYHLSGDAEEYCICGLTDQPCLGRIIDDPENRSSQFFSRGKCMIDLDRIKRCPVYGLSKELYKQVVKERAEKALEEKLKNIEGI